MERVAFLIEETGERLGALLNPASLVMRRQTGVRPRRSLGGPLTGLGLTDDPLLFTGGGRTELDLELLFDVSLAGSTIETTNVRDLTGPLWNLAENAAGADGYGQARLVRFVWGKAWNFLGAVAAVAERLEQFGPDGAPQRSWLHLRLVRVSEPPAASPAAPALPGLDLDLLPLPAPEGSPADPPAVPNLEGRVHEVVGGGGDDAPTAGERLDQIATDYYGDPTLWRLIARINDIADPLRLAGSTLLQIPSRDEVAPWV